MSFTSSSVHSLRRVFRESFVVHDITEPLISFDATTTGDIVRQHMEANALEVVGIREAGRVVGFVQKDDLSGSACGDQRRDFEPSQIVVDSASLAELVILLKDRRRMFVSLLGNVGGIVSRTDLQKPPVRMWLFGMITLIEMRFNRLIDVHCPSDSWTQYLSDGRIAKAKSLQAERQRRNQHVGLLDCLQLSDKAQIFARDEQLRGMMRFQSKRQLEETAKMVEKLRNNLAHSQDIITGDWDTIVRLSENLDAVLEGPRHDESQV
jgi:hypothetical protein